MNKVFLYDILNTPSPSGYEIKMQKKWAKHIREYVDKVQCDNIGNVYATINPSSPFKVLLAAHSDEIAFIVRKIDNNGFVYVDKLGGISPKPALGMKVKIGKNYGVVGTNAEHHGGTKKDFGISDLYIDFGFSNKKEALEYVALGDIAIYDIEPFELAGDKLASKALDNKSGLFILTEVLKRLKERTLDVCVVGVSTVNEETNMGGAYFAASRIKPDMALAIDVTFAGDYPRSDEIDVELGKGPVLAKGAPINIKILDHFSKVAANNEIAVQYEITPRITGTDADAMRKTGMGVPVGLVSLPLRYMHAPYEVCSLLDIESEINLIVEAVVALKKDFDLCPLT